MTCFWTDDGLKVQGITHGRTHGDGDGILGCIRGAEHHPLCRIHVGGKNTEGDAEALMKFLKGERGGEALDTETGDDKTLETLPCIHSHMKEPAGGRVRLLNVSEIKARGELIELVQREADGEAHGHEGAGGDAHPFTDGVEGDVFGEFLECSCMRDTAYASSREIDASGKHFRRSEARRAVVGGA